MTIHFPTLNAVLNFASALQILLGFYFVKKNRVEAHKRAMVGACATSALFLVSYLYYHYMHGSTKYGGEGLLRSIYFTILITHTVLAVIVLPMVIATVFFGISNKIEKHKKIAKFTFPVWLYVSVTGVVIYWMLYRM